MLVMILGIPYKLRSMIKIICTGRPGHGGIAASLEKFYPDTVFISKSNDYDLTLPESYNKFIKKVKDYNVFINHSQIDVGMQEKLLRGVFNEWKENNICGHIISIGSIVELDEWSWLDPKTSKEKLSIRNTSLCLNCENIKTTHFITSGFNRYGPEKDIKIDPDKIVNIIKTILEIDIDIPLIYVEHTDDTRLEKWRSIRSS